MLSISCKEVFYDKQRQIEDKNKIKSNKKIIKMVNNLIDIILDSCAVRNNHNNACYKSNINGNELTILYNTNVWGEQPRYEIRYLKPINHYGSHQVIYQYYYGEIFVYTDSMKVYNTKQLKNNNIDLLFFITELKTSKAFNEVKINNELDKILNYLRKNVDLASLEH